MALFSRFLMAGDGSRRLGCLSGARRSLEVRSYEASHVHGLWHADFHVGSRAIVLPDGRWQSPVLYASLDDCCRVCLHAQWYLWAGRSGMTPSRRRERPHPAAR
jgi:hypothetical protein